MGNKINAPAFMIAENPMAGNQLFIIHTGIPFVMAEVFHFEPHQEMEIMDCQRQFTLFGKTDMPLETAVIGAIMMVPDDKFLKYTTQEQADKLASLMRRMADWYHAYVKWEDNNNGE